MSPSTNARSIESRQQSFIDWTAALRSGQYEQAFGNLRSIIAYNQRPSYGHCCLGVACDLDLKQRHKRWTSNGFYVAPKHNGVADEDDAEWTVSMRQHFGMTRAEELELIALNDSQCKSFDEIANYIDREIMPSAMSRAYPYVEPENRKPLLSYGN